MFAKLKQIKKKRKDAELDFCWNIRRKLW